MIWLFAKRFIIQFIYIKLTACYVMCWSVSEGLFEILQRELLQKAHMKLPLSVFQSFVVVGYKQ